MKFEQLSNAVSDSSRRFVLNEEGRKKIQEYHHLIASVAAAIETKIQPYLAENFEKDIESQAALQVIALINSSKAGTKEFDIMSQLDKLTSGGKTDIDGNRFTFHQEDPIKKYIDPVQRSAIILL